MDKIEALTPAGVWVTLAEWNANEAAEYDAEGWIDNWGDRIGKSTARLPNGGFVDLRAFCAIRPCVAA